MTIIVDHNHYVLSKEGIRQGKINQWFSWSLDQIICEETGKKYYALYIEGDWEQDFPTIKQALAYVKDLKANWNE